MNSVRMLAGAIIAERFIIERAAGHGGMGTVYCARDLQSGFRVALKIMHQTGSSRVAAQRFTRETKLLEGLQHPGIVKYLAHGYTPEGAPFLAMQWLEGEDLAYRLRTKGLTLHESLALIRQVALALDVAHQQGIVHRDIKPGNLFLRDGEVDRVTLLDFGIARQMEADGSLTQTGEVLGTPQYMSPEQASGQLNVSPSVDVFSLGCVLFECLTGKPPFFDDQVSVVLGKILLQPAPLLRQLRPSMPESVESLLVRMLAKDAAVRFPDASALYAALAALPHFPDQEPPTDLAVRSLPGNSSSGEQQLVSVIVVSPDATIHEEMPTLAMGPAATRADLRMLRQLLAPYGAQAEMLADGSVVATLVHADTGNATDLVLQAARCVRPHPQGPLAQRTYRAGHRARNFG